MSDGFFCVLLSTKERIMQFSKNFGGKFLQGCGCLSIGLVVCIILICIIPFEGDDEESGDGEKQEQKTEQVEKKDSNFGNARYARNLFEKSIQRQANRLANVNNATTEQLTLLTIDDVKWGTK